MIDQQTHINFSINEHDKDSLAAPSTRNLMELAFISTN